MPTPSAPSTTFTTAALPPTSVLLNNGVVTPRTWIPKAPFITADFPDPRSEFLSSFICSMGEHQHSQPYGGPLPGPLEYVFQRVYFQGIWYSPPMYIVDSFSNGQPASFIGTPQQLQTPLFIPAQTLNVGLSTLIGRFRMLESRSASGYFFYDLQTITWYMQTAFSGSNKFDIQWYLNHKGIWYFWYGLEWSSPFGVWNIGLGPNELPILLKGDDIMEVYLVNPASASGNLVIPHDIMLDCR